GEAAMFEAALIENVQRQDLNPIEEAMGYQRLGTEFGMTQAEISAAVGKSRSHVANLMRLATLEPEVQELVRSGQLSVGHAKVLVGATFAKELAEEVVEKNLSVRQLEERVRAVDELLSGNHRLPEGATVVWRPPAGAADGKDADTRALEEELTDALGLEVDISLKGPTAGTISVRFSTLDQLDTVISRLQAR
ncbi:MAG: ParB/RepB/Spo0J family partition protein, partial [Thermaurantiacus sp.]